MLLLLVACFLPSDAPGEASDVPSTLPPGVVAPASPAVALEAGIERLGGTRFRPPTGAVDVAFAPDESWLVIVDQSGSLHRYSLPDGEPAPVQSPCEDSATSVALSPDGKLMAVACDYDSVRIVEVGTGKVVRNLPGSAERLRWAEDGSSMAIWSEWQMRWVDDTGRVLHRLAVSYSSDWDNQGSVWAVLNVGEQPELTDTGRQAADGTSLVVFEPGKSERVRKDLGGEAQAVALGDDGDQVVVLYQDRILALDTRSGERSGGHLLDDTWMTDLVRGRDGWWAAGQGRLWRLDEGLEVISFTEEADYERLFASPKGSYIVGLGTSRPGLWSHDGTDLVKGDGLPDSAGVVATSTDGQVVAGVTWEGSLFWANRSSSTSQTLNLEGGARSLDVSPDGSVLAVAVDAGVKLVDTSTAAIRVVRLENGSPGWIGFAANGTLYALSSYDPVMLHAVDVAQGRVTHTRALSHRGDSQAAVLSADGSTLVVPMENGQLDVITLQP